VVLIERAKGWLPQRFVPSPWPAAIKQTGRDGSVASAQDDRHVQASPSTVQSDIAAVGLPEGPGLTFKVHFYRDIVASLKASRRKLAPL
jgi:hypothetical protein